MQFVSKFVKKSKSKSSKGHQFTREKFENLKDQIMPAPGGCEHPAQLSRGDPPIYGYLDKATFFSGAESCVGPGTTEMPLRDGEGRNRCTARVCTADFECELPAQLSRRDPMICGYLDKATAISGADCCAWTTETPLKIGNGQNHCAARV